MINLPPYALALDMRYADVPDGNQGSGDSAAPIICMPFGQKVQGRPGFLHGGSISALLEMAAITAIHSELERRGDDQRIRQANVTLDFMRGGVQKDTFGQGEVTRLGRTMANVSARLWQDDPEHIIAQAYMHYLIG